MRRSEQIGLPLRLKDSASLENFFVGDNQQVVDLLKSLADRQTQRVAYLHGPLGSGKSHLLQAFCRKGLSDGKTPFYISLAMREVPIEVLDDLAFQGAVCLDDVDAVAGRKDWEEGLLNLFETLAAEGGQFLLAGRYPPIQAGFVLADLATRLASGGVWAVQPLAEQDLPEAMRLRARQRGLDLPDAVISYLIRRMPRDPASVFALLDEIDRQALAHQRRLTVPFVKDLATQILDS
ncbi:MAG: DnaA regulatory inactivator Hda [Quisquiliibacterium sp.]